MPLFKLMFTLQAERTHEEIELLAIDFSTMFIENLGLLPRWRDHYRAHDQTPHYEYLKKVLQALQWLRGPERWLLKTPQHLEQFGPLMKVFPDATVVITHRDPVATVASMTTMVSYAARMSREPVRPRDRQAAGAAIPRPPVPRVQPRSRRRPRIPLRPGPCLLYTSDAADERSSGDLGGRRLL